jgi:hypothetical protein
VAGDSLSYHERWCNYFAVKRFDEEESLTGVHDKYRREVSIASAELYQVTVYCKRTNTVIKYHMNFPFISVCLHALCYYLRFTSANVSP